MKRITTDDPKGNFDVLMNYCYGKDRQATLQYAGEKTEVPLHAYVAPFCKQKGCIEDDGISMEDLSEVILDPMGDCSDCPYGIVYFLGCQAAETRAHLKSYEDTGLSPEEIKQVQDALTPISFGRFHNIVEAEHAGRLVVFPCKVRENCFVAIHTNKRVLEITVSGFTYSVWHDAWIVSAANDCQFLMDNAYRTKAEAEAALNTNT